MSFSATIKTALEAVRRLTGLDEFWNLIGGFYISSDDHIKLERMRSQWTSDNAIPAASIEVVEGNTLDKPLGIESNSTITLLFPSSLADTVTAADLALELIRGVARYVYKEVRGYVISSDLAENHTALILAAFPIEGIMALPGSDSTGVNSTEAVGPAGLSPSEPQVITPEIASNLGENRPPPASGP